MVSRAGRFLLDGDHDDAIGSEPRFGQVLPPAGGGPPPPARWRGSRLPSCPGAPAPAPRIRPRGIPFPLLTTALMVSSRRISLSSCPASCPSLPRRENPQGREGVIAQVGHPSPVARGPGAAGKHLLVHNREEAGQHQGGEAAASACVPAPSAGATIQNPRPRPGGSAPGPDPPPQAGSGRRRATAPPRWRALPGRHLPEPPTAASVQPQPVSRHGAGLSPSAVTASPPLPPSLLAWASCTWQW